MFEKSLCLLAIYKGKFNEMRRRYLFSLSSFFLLFPLRSARSHRVRLGHSGHRLSAQTDDVHNHAAARVLHSLGVRRRDDPHADLASDQVRGAVSLGTPWGRAAPPRFRLLTCPKAQGQVCAPASWGKAHRQSQVTRQSQGDMTHRQLTPLSPVLEISG